MAAKGDRGRCDQIASALTRRVEQCEYCGTHVPFGELHTSHYVSRTISWTRTHLPNLVSACPSCHFKVGSRPDIHYRWFVYLRGEEVEREIHQRTLWTDKFKWAEERERLEQLAVAALSEPLSPQAEVGVRRVIRKRSLNR
ncbi:MAG: hypothetical protein HKN37_16445 [Rhodothermales bacterium]|nr:hypothetical protein [Rhodothermales bacterium]